MKKKPTKQEKPSIHLTKKEFQEIKKEISGKKPVKLSLSDWSINSINSKARKWFISQFPPIYAEEAKSFDKEIEALSLPFPFWVMAELAGQAYFRAKELRERQNQATQKYRSLKYEISLFNSIAKKVEEGIRDEIIEPVVITPHGRLSNRIFDDPKGHTLLKKPISAFTTTMAKSLIDCGLSKQMSSKVTHRFVTIYLPPEKKSKDSKRTDEQSRYAETIRRKLYR
jgi:hypothetical protein